MKKLLFAASGLAMLGAIGSAEAAMPSDMDGANTPAGKVVVQYLALQWGPNRNLAAAMKLMSPSLIEHGYLGMAGSRPPAGALPEGARGGPSPTIEVKKIVAEGDLVFVQGLGRVGTKGNGDLMWILYRVDSGLITEHWDTHNPIPDDQVGKQF